MDEITGLHRFEPVPDTACTGSAPPNSNFSDPDAIRGRPDLLQPSASRHLLHATREPTTELINSEVAAKSTELREMAAVLTVARSRMKRAPGCPTVIDTNLLLQCQRPDYIKWPEGTDDQRVRLTIPRRVLEELEARKYDTKDRRRDVAREVLPWLDRLFSGADCGPVPLGDRGDTTIEVLFADRPRDRPSDADDEILDTTYRRADLGTLVFRIS